MNLLKQSLLVLITICTFLSIQSCKDEDVCENIVCQNGGICIDGSCDCPEGYQGTNCELLDLVKIQELLDAGHSPKELFDEGVSLDDLYGKIYKGGLIFHLDTIDGSGLITATEDQSSTSQWGCNSENIMTLSNVQTSPPTSGLETEVGARIGDGKENTDKILLQCPSSSAQLCRDLGEEWFLPSREELNLIYNNLQKNGHGSFDFAVYWSSTEYDELESWAQGFGSGNQFENEKELFLNVRAAKAF